MGNHFLMILICAMLNSVLAVSLILILVLPLRPILDRYFYASGRLQLWYGLAVAFINCIHLSFAESSFAAIQLHIPELRLLGDTSIFNILLWGWLAGFTGILVWYFLQHIAFLRYVKRWSVPAQNEVLLEVVAQVLRKIGPELDLSNVTGPLQILICDRLSGPMITGYFAPMLLLPRENYSKADAYYICLHELTHWKNKDVDKRIWYLLLNAFCWFAPPLWAMRRWAYRDMELCCDEAVLAGVTIEEKKQYCQTLLDAVPQNSGRTTVLTTYFRGGGPSLKERLSNIWWVGRRHSGVLLYILADVAILLVCIFGVFIGPTG